MQREGLLHGALVLSAHARARVVRIDTSKAAALAGVRAVVTAADVPGERWYGLLYADWPGFVAEGEEVRCVGDVLAAVAADDARTARAAAALVEVEYEPLPPVLDPEAALAPGAPQVNPKHPNLLSRSVIRRGDAAAALAASAHVVTGTWRTQRIEHLFLEPEAALAEPLPDGRLALYTQGQGVFDDRRQVARFLGVPEERVHVELVPSGGAFGGKEDMSVQAQTALLARVTGRPVKLVLDREESVRIHPKRHPHPARLHGRAATPRAGSPPSWRASSATRAPTPRSGARCSSARPATPAARTACRRWTWRRSPSTRTTRPAGPCAASACPRRPSPSRAASTSSRRRSGLDGWEIRSRNAVDVGDAVTTGQVLEKSVGLRKTLDAVKDAYYGARRAGKAVGIACGLKNCGIGNGVAEWGKCRLVVETGRHGLALQRLHGDGPGPAHRPRAVRGRGDRACRPPSSTRRWTRPSPSAAARRPARGRRSSAAARSRARRGSCAPTSTRA